MYISNKHLEHVSSRIFHILTVAKKIILRINLKAAKQDIYGEKKATTSLKRIKEELDK